MATGILVPTLCESIVPPTINQAIPAISAALTHSFTIAKYHKLSSRGNSSELEMETRASSSSHDSGPSVDDRGFEEIDTIRLIGEKTRFKVGERAKIQINSPFAGEAQALVTIERGNVVSQDLITLPNNSLTYEFEILPEHVPNIYISAFIVNALRRRTSIIPSPLIRWVLPSYVWIHSGRRSTSTSARWDNYSRQREK